MPRDKQKVKNAVFVVVTADRCPACEQFKATNLSKLKKFFGSKKNVKLVHVNFSSTRADNIPSNANPHIMRKLRVFPSFFLWTEDSWKDKDSGTLEGEEFNTEDMFGPKGLGDPDQIWKIIEKNLDKYPFIGDKPKEPEHVKSLAKAPTKATEKEEAEKNDTVRFILITVNENKVKFNANTLKDNGDQIKLRKITR